MNKKHWTRGTKKLYPEDPSYPWGFKRASARLGYVRKLKMFGEMAPVTRAALGRMLFHGGEGYEKAVPESDDTAIESVAWHRESGVRKGFMNRSMRKHTHNQTRQPNAPH